MSKRHSAFLGGFLAIVGGMTSYAQAADLVAPFSIEDAKVLPKNVGNPRFLQLSLSIDSKFSPNGGTDALGKPLNREITGNDLIKAQKSEMDKSQLAGLIAAEGLEGPFAKSVGAVTTDASVMVPAIAFGITDRFTLAAAVPIYKMNVAAGSGTVRTEAGEKLISKIQEQDVEKANDAARKLNRAVDQTLEDDGYSETIHSKTISSVGDVQLIGKYLLTSDSERSIALKPVLTLPTGLKPNADLAIDVPTGDGRWKFGTELIHDVKLDKDWRWNQTVSYTFLFANKMERRLPVSSEEAVSADKETLNRRMGDVFFFSTGIDHFFPDSGIVVGAGYSYQYQSQDRYTGSNPANSDRYRLLEDLYPAQSLHAMTLTAGFSSVEWYQAKKFVYPFQANLAYSIPITGQNAPTANLLAGELVLFF